MRLGATCVFVEDVPAVLDFYRRAFGCETRHFDEEYQCEDARRVLHADGWVGEAVTAPSPELPFAHHGGRTPVQGQTSGDGRRAYR
jgi:catechol 2,3-dioxygenase-like lactoylglutathione lyase family enzyme